MNEFLDLLSKALGRMSAEQKEDILSDYREHFDAGRRKGKSDAAIAAALGDPRQLGRMFTADRAVERAQRASGINSVLHMLGAIARYQLLGGLVMGCLYLAALCVLITLFAAAFALVAAGTAALAYMVFMLIKADMIYAPLGGSLTLMFVSAGLLSTRGCAALWRRTIGRLPYMAERLMRAKRKGDAR
ncbi:MAG TPA: DUF1700 domain-containing protein [Feifaniaceae bacterium]|nr:DUF1700 domain-containing protein [Feifaniaceae bacterium]